MDQPIQQRSRINRLKRVFRRLNHSKRSTAPDGADRDGSKQLAVRSTTSQQVSSTSNFDRSSEPSIPIDEETALSTARNRLWERVYENFKNQQPELALVYEKLLKEDAGIDQEADPFAPEATAAVVQKQRRRMEARQWTYSWFGKPQKVREKAESILTTIQKVSGIASVGVSSAPPFVSLLWSMATSLVAFVMSDFDAVNSAVDGLEEVTVVMAAYNIVEREFLLDMSTRTKFEDIVLSLYTAILEFQARAAQYFSRNTLRRLEINTLTACSWSDAIEKVRKLEHLCQAPISTLGTQLTKRQLDGIGNTLSLGIRLMEQISRSVTSERSRREKISEWISPINHLQDHVDIRRTIGDSYLGSGQWLLQDVSEFKPWKHSENDILFLKGVVGSGKTSLTSMVIQNLLEEESVAFFYCSANASPHDPSRTAHNETYNIFQNILAQCATCKDRAISPQIQDAFDRSDRQFRGGCEMTLGGVMSTLKDVLNEDQDKQMTLIIDALDECKDQCEVLSCLADLQSATRKLRAFVSTRFGVDVSQSFATYRAISMGTQNSPDIRAYIDSEISRRGSGISLSQAVRLKNAIDKHADGVFRWVVLEIDLFLPRNRRQGARMMPRDIDRRLDGLEKSQAPAVARLFDAYEEIYQYALGDDDETARRYVVRTAIKWVLCSFAQLSIKSLRHAVSILPDGTRDEDITADHIRDYCSNFLVVVSDDLVKVAHLSVRQFFEGRRESEFSPSQQHLQVALTCLHIVRSFHIEDDTDYGRRDRRFLNFAHLRSGLVNNGQTADPLNEYVYSFWSLHCRAASDCETLASLLDCPEVRDVLGPELDALHSSIAKKANLTTRDCLGNTALHWAVLNHDLWGLELLLRVETHLERSGLVNIQNKAGNSALYLAAMLGQETAFLTLFLNGGKIDEMNRSGLSATHVAVILDKTRILRAIGWLHQWPNDRNGNSLLHYASFFDRGAAAGVLIRAGSPLDVQNSSGDTPLHLASRTGSRQTYRALISANASTSIRNFENQLASDLYDTSRFAEVYLPEIRQQQARIADLNPCGHASVKITDPEIMACSYCNLEGWLNESANGGPVTYISSREERLQMSRRIRDGKLTCKLCNLLDAVIEDELNDSRIGEVEEVTVRARLDIDSPRLETGKDSLVLSAVGREHEIDICIDAEDAAHSTTARLFRGRSVTSHTEEQVIGQIKEWMGQCQAHGSCRGQSSYSPPYLIDVGYGSEEVQPRLVNRKEVERTDNRKYVFLTSPWIRSPAYNLDLELYSNPASNTELDLKRIKPQHQDAIRICRKLGYRYLWADAIFDLEYDEDFPPESVRKYMQEADLVLLVTGNYGRRLATPQSASRMLSISARLREEPNSEDRPFTLRLRDSLKSTTRTVFDGVLIDAWRLEEVLLPRRCVLFDDQQLLWSCGEMSRSEGSTVTHAPWFETLPSFKNRLERSCQPPEAVKTEIFRYWHSICEMSSQGDLPLCAHRLNVIDEFANTLSTILQLHFGEAQCIKGIWHDNMPQGLLWTSWRPTSAKHHSQFDLDDDDRSVPSWSWVSNRTPISYKLIPGLKLGEALDGCLRVLDVHLSPLNWAHLPALPVSALAKEIALDSTEAQTFEYFWDAIFCPRNPKGEGWFHGLLREEEGAQEKDRQSGGSKQYNNPTDHVSESVQVVPPFYRGTHAHWAMANLASATLILVAPWTFRPSLELCDARWAGLVLRRREEPLSGYVRKGVFLGPLCDQELVGWERKTLELC